MTQSKNTEVGNLCITRTEGESIMVNGIEIRIGTIRGNKVRVWVIADKSVNIHRKEILPIRKGI